MTGKLNMKKNRVDFQVSLIIAVIVLTTFICVYFFNYYYTYNDMLHSLEERCTSIYSYIDKSLNKSTFYDINTREDMAKSSYTDMKEKLSAIKSATGVRYLYTAKKTDDGSYIYIVDGLLENSLDFRYPGAPIENEIIPTLERALQDKIILLKDILDTSWGNIFISYFPIHDNGQVVGVVGIEFEAVHQYETFRTIRFGTPLIAVGFCLVAICISVFLFRRISNPTYKDFANTDYLTGLKNRNAFDVIMNNMESRKYEYSDIGMMVIDLNGLKIINDTYGHQIGDAYIQEAAKILVNCSLKRAEVYRVGGDEFVIIFDTCTKEQLVALTKLVHEQAQETYLEGTNIAISMAIGWAKNLDNDETLQDIYKRADQKMYEYKRKFKKEGH